MSDKRDTNRQRRASQNKAAREALVARRQAAQKVAPDPEPAASRRRRSSRAQGAPVVPAKPKAARAAAGGSAGRSFAPPVEDEPPASGILARTEQLAGGRQMLAGFVLVLAGSPFAAFVPMFREKGSKHNESLVALLGIRSLILLLVPVVIAAIPLLTLNHRRRRMAWNVAAFLLGLWVLTTGLLAFYVLGLLSIVWGLMKSSRAEGPAATGRGLFRRPPRATSGDAALDVTGVEADADRVSD